MQDFVAYTPEWRPGVGLIQLKRPGRRNALPASCVRQAMHFIEQAEDDGITRCLVLRGDQTAFCAGADLEEMSDPDPFVVLRATHVWTKLYLAVRQSLLPVIAVVEGPCVGGGYHLSMAADYTLATTNAWFRHTGIDVGMVPLMPATLMAPAGLGLKRASSMVLSPRKVSADEALGLGLISEIAAVDELEFKLHTRADQLASSDPFAVAIAKAQLNVGVAHQVGAAVLSQLTGFLHSTRPDVQATIRHNLEGLSANRKQQ